MAGNTFGSIFRVTTFGESHGNGLGVIIDGCPAGIKIDAAKIQEALDKRRPGAAINGIKTAAVTQRSEPDQAEILSGVFEGISEGTPISIVIRNTSQHSMIPPALSPFFLNSSILSSISFAASLSGARIVFWAMFEKSFFVQEIPAALKV